MAQKFNAWSKMKQSSYADSAQARNKAWDEDDANKTKSQVDAEEAMKGEPEDQNQMSHHMMHPEDDVIIIKRPRR